MYSSARSVAWRVFSSDIVRGSGTRPSTPVTMPGLVPQRHLRRDVFRTSSITVAIVCRARDRS